MTTIKRSLENGLNQAAIIFLNYPRESHEGALEFYCEIGVEIKGKIIKERAYGIDAFQALVMGIYRLSSIIDLINESLDQENKWYWDGGMSRDDFGLPRQ